MDKEQLATAQQEVDAIHSGFDTLGGGNAGRKGSVSYYYDEEFAVYQLGLHHVMKPFRIRMTDQMVKAYDLYDKMKIMDIDEQYIE